jgi:hypothetical protein
MDEQLEPDLGQIKMATAALVACIVQTLDESDPTFRDRFEHRVDEWYYAIRDRGHPDLHALELLAWARDAARSARPFDPPGGKTPARLEAEKEPQLNLPCLVACPARHLSRTAHLSSGLRCGMVASRGPRGAA